MAHDAGCAADRVDARMGAARNVDFDDEGGFLYVGALNGFRLIGLGYVMHVGPLGEWCNGRVGHMRRQFMPPSATIVLGNMQRGEIERGGGIGRIQGGVALTPRVGGGARYRKVTHRHRIRFKRHTLRFDRSRNVFRRVHGRGQRLTGAIMRVRAGVRQLCPDQIAVGRKIEHVERIAGF